MWNRHLESTRLIKGKLNQVRVLCTKTGLTIMPQRSEVNWRAWWLKVNSGQRQTSCTRRTSFIGLHLTRKSWKRMEAKANWVDLSFLRTPWTRTSQAQDQETILTKHQMKTSIAPRLWMILLKATSLQIEQRAEADLPWMKMKRNHDWMLAPRGSLTEIDLIQI